MCVGGGGGQYNNIRHDACAMIVFDIGPCICKYNKPHACMVFSLGCMPQQYPKSAYKQNFAKVRANALQKKLARFVYVWLSFQLTLSVLIAIFTLRKGFWYNTNGQESDVGYTVILEIM